MSASCCSATTDDTINRRYRRALWMALAVNVVMFAVEFIASFSAESASLLADSVDFAGDAANYGLSLGAIALGAVWQSRTALLKGMSMMAYGVLVLALAGWRWLDGSNPEPMTMGVVGGIALAANVAVAALLFAYREGNANMRSVWLCTRNDAISNAAVLVAALGVLGSGSRFPDLAVAAVMAMLAMSAGAATVRHALEELHAVRAGH